MTFVTLRRRAFLTGAAALGATIALPIPAPAAPVDVEKLYDAAKREGSVIWWTSEYTQPVCEKIQDAFKAKYPGVDVSLLRETTGTINQRILQNLKSSVHDVDVFGTTDELQYGQLKSMNALAAFQPNDSDKIVAPFRRLDPDWTYQLGAVGFVLFNFDPRKIAPPPNDWMQLLNPTYKGHISLGHPAFSGYVAQWAIVMRDRYGWDPYFGKLAADQPKIGRSIFEVANDIISGESVIGAGTDKLAYQRKAQGDPVDVSFPKRDLVVIAAPSAILKDAPHPNAARLFTNFLYSREFSQTLVATYDYPLRSDVTPANGLRLEKVNYTRVSLEQQQQGVPDVIARWRATFGV